MSCVLILVFGVWMNPCTITRLYQHRKECEVRFSDGSWHSFKRKKCDIIAREIIKQQKKARSEQ